MRFLKAVMASCLGVILALGLGIFLLISFSASMGQKEKVSLSSNSVLELTFDAPIPEKTNNTQRDGFSLESEDIVGLKQWVETINHAKNDPKIKGILLHPDMSGLGMATAGVIRAALEDFRKEGKFIVSYADYYTNGSYYLASTADKIYMHPIGRLDFRGFATAIPFFKDMLDRVGIKPEIYFAGQFKGATEPFRLNKMSDPNRLQTKAYLDGLYAVFLEDIARTRKIPVATLQNIAATYSAGDAKGALKTKMIDQIGMYDDVLVDIRKRLALGEKEEIKTIDLEDYTTTFARELNVSAKNKIAVVYAEGEINGNKEDQDGAITQDRYLKLLREIREDDKVKAIVLRINSPGGDALTSESILQELKLSQKAGKKVIVSMGDYAASGGYYIAASADSIFAERNTITGSIGVFAMTFSLNKVMNEKLGIHYDTITTGSPYATMMLPFFDKSPNQGAILQGYVDTLYETFLNRVSTGRNMSRDAVHAIAQGRVWTGDKAKEIGLVDAIGGLDQALAAAAKMANITEYRLTEYPKIKDPITQMIEKFLGKKASAQMRTEALKAELGALYPYYAQMQLIGNMQGPQMRLVSSPIW